MSTASLEKVLKKFPNLYRSKGSLSCSQDTATGPYHSQLNQHHVLTFYSFKTHFNSIIHLSLSLPSYLCASDFPIKTVYAFFISSICATHPTHHIFLDFGEEYKL
jgi:hypothetical protein